MTAAGFNVHVLPHDRMVGAHPDQTLLDAVLAAGLDATHSCRLGCCGSCTARLLAGAIEYPSGRMVTSGDAQQPEGIMLCIARARSDVTVELRFTRAGPWQDSYQGTPTTIEPV